MELSCVNCGQCALVCPTGLSPKEMIPKGFGTPWLTQPNTWWCRQLPPSGYPSAKRWACPGTRVTKRLVAALRRLGFDKVFDTDFSADLTIMEEGSELLERLAKGGTLPMITSCSPGWIKFIEHYYRICCLTYPPANHLSRCLEL